MLHKEKMTTTDRKACNTGRDIINQHASWFACLKERVIRLESSGGAENESPFIIKLTLKDRDGSFLGLPYDWELSPTPSTQGRRD